MQYETIIFLQNDEADEALDILKEKGSIFALEYLRRWDYGDSGDWSERTPWGAGDDLYRIGAYVINARPSMGYIGLTKFHKEV